MRTTLSKGNKFVQINRLPHHNLNHLINKYKILQEKLITKKCVRILNKNLCDFVKGCSKV